MQSRFRLLVYSLSLALTLAPAPAPARIEEGPSSLVYPDFWHTPLGIHRGTPALLKLMLGDQARFADPAGAACTHMREKGSPSPQLTAFGLNRGLGQVVYNPDMKSLAAYGGDGAGLGQFHLPQGVACLPDGRVAVADTGNDRVVLLRFLGGTLNWERSLGSAGSGPGQFRQPGGVAFDSLGRLYVADTGNNRVQAFDAQGRYLYAFGGDPDANNSMVQPQAIAVVDPLEPYAAEAADGLYVIDLHHTRLQRFTRGGRFLGQATGQDAGRPGAYFDSLALDYFNNVWVTDRLAGLVDKFDQHLQWVDSWGHPGVEDGCLDSPRGIAIYRHYGQVLILEQQSAQYLWIGADVRDVRFSQQMDPQHGPQVRIDYRLTERAFVDAWIEDGRHERMATLLARRLQKQGAQTLLWSGDMDGGYRIPNGHYSLVFDVEATYASATYVKREYRRRLVVK